MINIFKSNKFINPVVTKMITVLLLIFVFLIIVVYETIKNYIIRTYLLNSRGETRFRYMGLINPVGH